MPTIYSERLSWQTQKVAAEIRYYIQVKCRELLEEMLENYNLLNFQSDETWDREHKHEYSQQADTARQIFRLFFCGRSGFESAQATESTLKSSFEKDGSSKLLDTMVVWCAAHFERFHKEDDAGYVYLEADTIQELREQVDPLLNPLYSFEKASLWPLVEFVQVGVPHSRVLQYVNLVDLPGKHKPGKLDCFPLLFIKQFQESPTPTNSESTLLMTISANVRVFGMLQPSTEPAQIPI